MNMTEDFFIPIRNQDTTTRIDTTKTAKVILTSNSKAKATPRRAE